MCDYKVEEHRMSRADVRTLAKRIVWNSESRALHEDAEAIVSLHLTNTPYHPFGDSAMYWQPDGGHEFNDYHRVTDEQFARVVDEVRVQTERVRKLLDISPDTHRLSSVSVR